MLCEHSSCATPGKDDNLIFLFPCVISTHYLLFYFLNFQGFFVNNCFVIFPCTWFFFFLYNHFSRHFGVSNIFPSEQIFFSFLSPIMFSLAPGFCSSYSFIILSQPSQEGAGAYIPLAFQMLTRVFWRTSDWQTNTSPKYSECSVTNSFILVDTVSKITLERDRPYF